MPVVFQSLPVDFSIAALVALIQIDLLLFLTGRRYLRWVAVAAAALVGAMIGQAAGASLLPGFVWAIIAAGFAGGALLGLLIRPLGMGLVLAYLGVVAATDVANIPFVYYIVAVDLFAYGLLLTDLAPTLVSSLLASSILFVAAIWTGASAPAAFVLASGTCAARLMASLLPSRLALRGRNPGIPRSI